MNISNGGLGFTQTLNNEDFKRKLRESMQEVNGFSAKSVASMDSIQVKASDLAKGIGAIFTVGAATNFIQEMVKVRGEFEQLEIAFTTMLGSKERADNLMMEIVDFAAKTPFGLQSTSEATKMLLAYGESAETALDTMRKLGDIASGVGIPLKDIAYLYGTTMTQGRLYTQDLNQFLGRGIPMLDELAKIFNVNKNEVKALVEEGKVGFPEVQKVIENLTASGSMFGGLMEAQSKSITGQIEQLKDAFDVMLNDLGKEAQPIVADVINGASLIVENYKEIGKGLIDLIAIYGSYKTAVIAVSLIESARAKTVTNQIANLGIADKMTLGRTAVLAKQAQQNLISAKSESVNQQAILNTMRSEVSALAVKKQKASALAIEKTQLMQNAQLQLALAQAELRSIQTTGTAKQISIAQKNVEKTQNQVIATQETAELARKNALAQSQSFYNAQQNLENQAKKTKIAQGAIVNAQEAAEVATKNLNSVATARLTLMQNLQVLKTKALTSAQSLLNATMLSNPVVAITATVLALVYAYNKLATEMSSTEKAQKTLSDLNLEAEKNIIKEKVALDELLKVAKDEKKSKEDRSKAIQELNKISPEYLGQLNLENINTQQATRATDAYTESIFKNAKAMAYRSKLEELYKLELEQKDAMKNGPKRNVFEKGGDVVFGLLGFSKEEIKNETDVARSVVTAFGKDILKDKAKFNVEYQKALKFYGFKDLLDTKHQIQAIKKEIEKDSLDAKKTVNEVVEDSFSGKTIKNKAYWEEQKKLASDARDALGGSEIGSKKWNELTNKINEANKALQAYNDSYKKPSSAKATKKSDDPLEVFKKEVSTYKEQYERLTNYLNTKDKELNIAGEALKITLSSKGQTYLDFLQKQAEQLRKSASSSELARKQLIVINDEIYSLLNQSQTEDFKKQIEKDLQSAQSLIERINLIKKAKEELAGKTDQISIDKLKFINEKELQNQFDVETYLKDEVNKFDEQYQYLEVKRKEYDADMLLLQEQYNKASNDSEKRRIQDLINIRSAQYFEDTNGKTNSVEVNQVLEESKNLAQKRLDIEKEYAGKISLIQAQINNETSADQLKLFTDVIAEIERKKKESLKNLDDEILKSSEKWVAIFADYSNKSVAEINQIVKDIESVLSNPPANLTATEVKNLQDRLIELKTVLKKDDPFNQLGDSVKRLAENFRLANGDINFEGINAVIANTKNALNEAISMAEGLGIGVSDSAKDAIQLGTELFSAGASIAEGIASKNPLQVVKGIVSGITSIINAGDRKKERQIQKYKQAVNELTKAFNQLQIATDKALGGDSYRTQQLMIENLRKQQEEYRKMIDAENGKKKTDKGKISDWEQAIIDSGNKINEIMDNITQDILQTTAKDLANTLGDALVDAFSKGEDAAKSFEKVANDVLKNAVLNQLKKNFLEKQLQSALDGLQEQMGVTGVGWSGLTPEQQQQFRDKIKDISAGFTGALDAYADLFKDLEGADANSLSGAIKGVSEETASLIAGQMNAIRIMQAESLEVNRNSNNILIQQLDQLFRIEFNTRNITPMLERIHNVLNTESSRGWGH